MNNYLLTELIEPINRIKEYLDSISISSKKTREALERIATALEKQNKPKNKTTFR